MEINGLTGLISFDKEGFRRDISLDIVELSKDGLEKVGRYMYHVFIQLHNLDNYNLLPSYLYIL